MKNKPFVLAAAMAAAFAPWARSQTAADVVARQIPGRDLRLNPPAIASMTLTPMGVSAKGEKGLLKVRFAETGLPATLMIINDGAVRTLHDDGVGEDAAKDGVYSTLLDFDLGELADFQMQLKASGQLNSLQSMAAASQDELVVAPLAGDSAPVPTPVPPPPPPLDPEKTLFIRDLSVVNSGVRTADPCQSTTAADAAKKWTFGYLITQMANQSNTGITPTKLALSLLRHWEKDQKVNGETVPARTAILQRITNQWFRESHSTTTLAMNKAPFRLLAIVNRVDLRQNLFFGEGLAGELRFVWGVLDLGTKAFDGSGTCQEDPSFTMIMEFAVDKKTQPDVKAWGKRWADLDKLTLNSTAYRVALEGITESVVKANVGAAFARANGSELIRIRTNEISLAGPWELREFNISKSGTNKGLFFEVPVKQTPREVYNNREGLPTKTLLRDYVNSHEAEIIAGKHNIPLTFKAPGSLVAKPFLGGHIFNNIDFWAAPGIKNNKARHLVSLNTCNGCHGAETNTGFLQVVPRPRSQPSQLAGFLTGVDVTDPVDFTTVRHFDDLRRRSLELNALVNSPSLAQLSFVPTNRTH